MEEPWRASNRRTGTWHRAGGLMVGAALLAGCGATEAGMLAGASVISYLETKKTVPEHVLSQVMDKDCAARYVSETGRLCTDGPRYAMDNGPSYCYRTLGEVTCYTTRDPYRSRSPEVAWPRPAESTAEVAAAGPGAENRGD